MFKLTAKLLLNVVFLAVVSSVETDAPIYQLVIYNVLIRQWSRRAYVLWEAPKQLEQSKGVAMFHQKDPGLFL